MFNMNYGSAIPLNLIPIFFDSSCPNISKLNARELSDVCEKVKTLCVGNLANEISSESTHPFLSNPDFTIMALKIDIICRTKENLFCFNLSKKAFAEFLDKLEKASKKMTNLSELECNLKQIDSCLARLMQEEMVFDSESIDQYLFSTTNCSLELFQTFKVLMEKYDPVCEKKLFNFFLSKSKDFYNETLFSIAAKKGHHQILDLLMDMAKNVSLSDRKEIFKELIFGPDFKDILSLVIQHDRFPKENLCLLLNSLENTGEFKLTVQNSLDLDAKFLSLFSSNPDEIKKIDRRGIINLLKLKCPHTFCFIIQRFENLTDITIGKFLRLAIIYGLNDAVKKLLDLKDCVNFVLDKKKNTPLHLAVIYFNREIFITLRHHKADPFIKNLEFKNVFFLMDEHHIDVSLLPPIVNKDFTIKLDSQNQAANLLWYDIPYFTQVEVIYAQNNQWGITEDHPFGILLQPPQNEEGAFPKSWKLENVKNVDLSGGIFYSRMIIKDIFESFPNAECFDFSKSQFKFLSFSDANISKMLRDLCPDRKVHILSDHFEMKSSNGKIHELQGVRVHDDEENEAEVKLKDQSPYVWLLRHSKEPETITCKYFVLSIKNLKKVDHLLFAWNKNKNIFNFILEGKIHQSVFLDVNVLINSKLHELREKNGR